MAHDYPHLNDSKFPDLDTVNAYKYQNDYPYDSYGVTTKLKLMNVPWCGDYDNVAYFETKELRDKWFEGQNGIVKEMPTMFRLYAGGDIKVELPIDECMKYNYIMIDYGNLPNQQIESNYSKMFYFISDMVQDSVNTTRLILSVDYWTSYIYDMGITYVNLQRGHAPMAETSVEQYLANPLDESEYLLTPDVNYGTIQRVANEYHEIFNEYTGDDAEHTITLGFQTNASMEQASLWGDMIPTAAYESSQAFSCVDPFVLEDITYWETFRENVMATYPHFFETVKGMFIIPKKLITYYEEDDFTFCNVPCHFLASHTDIKQADFKISRDMFDYPDALSDIAKLYTSPYASIEVNDFKGNTMEINIEDTTGTLGIHTVMCDMYPFMNVEAYLTGAGGSNKSTIRFQNNYTHTMVIGGRFYDFKTKWAIPVFAVQLEAEKNWELNGKIGADASLQNTDTQLELNRLKKDLSNKTLESITTGNQNAEKAIFADNKWYQNYIGEYNKILAGTIFDADVDYGSTIVNNNNTASIATGTFNAVTNFGAGVMDSVIEKDPSSAISAGVGVAQSIVNTGVNVALSNANYSSLVSKDTNVYQAYWGNKDSAFGDGGFNYWNWKHTNDFDYKKLQATQAAVSGGSVQTYDIDSGGSASISLHGSNNYTIEATNESYDNYKKATNEIADRNYDANHKQTLLSNPPEFGQMTGTPDIVSKPFGLSFNILTQSRNAIRQAGEQMLRYGYILNMQWKIGSFNIMPKFSYWQCDSVYCSDNGVYEGAQAMIKSILHNGVTVWRNPSDIGVTSIYDN